MTGSGRRRIRAGSAWPRRARCSGCWAREASPGCGAGGRDGRGAAMRAPICWWPMPARPAPPHAMPRRPPPPCAEAAPGSPSRPSRRSAPPSSAVTGRCCWWSLPPAKGSSPSPAGRSCAPCKMPVSAGSASPCWRWATVATAASVPAATPCARPCYAPERSNACRPPGRMAFPRRSGRRGWLRSPLRCTCASAASRNPKRTGRSTSIWCGGRGWTTPPRAIRVRCTRWSLRAPRRWTGVLATCCWSRRAAISRSAATPSAARRARTTGACC